MDSKRLSELRYKGHITNSEYWELKNTIEALENKNPHGEWITRHKLNSFGQDVVCFECNKCGEYTVPLYHLMITEPLKICPNCGIDMRGEQNGNKS